MARSVPLLAVLSALTLPLAAQPVGPPDGRDERVLPRELHPVAQDLDLLEQTVDADIRDRLAQVTVVSTFENRTGRVVEGVYLFPIPPRRIECSPMGGYRLSASA